MISSYYFAFPTFQVVRPAEAIVVSHAGEDGGLNERRRMFGIIFDLALAQISEARTAEPSSFIGRLEMLRRTTLHDRLSHSALVHEV